MLRFTLLESETAISFSIIYFAIHTIKKKCYITESDNGRCLHSFTSWWWDKKKNKKKQQLEINFQMSNSDY